MIRIISERFSIFLIFLGAGLLLCFTTAFLWKCYIIDFNQTINSEKFGQFGDIVGGVTGSIWALAGVLLFYISLKEQRKVIETSVESLRQQQLSLAQQEIALKQQKESIDIQNHDLKQQRQEFQKTNQFLEEQTNIAKEQSYILRIQHFESNFYSLIELNQKVKINLLRSHEGKNLFREIVSCLRHNLINSWAPVSNNDNCRKKYLKVFFKNKDILGHYYKTIDRILQIVEDSELEDRRKFFYVKTLRSQLTENELILLYYHSATDLDNTLYNLSLKYNLFKHLPFVSKLECNFLFDSNHLINSNRSFITSKIDQYLQRNLQYLLDISTEENRLSKEIATDSTSFIVELVDEHDVFISFHFTSDDILTFLNFNERELVAFFEIYLYDRFFFSQYVKCTATDNRVLVYTSGDFTSTKILQYKIETSRDINVCSDDY